jgi:holin-like protein
MGMEISRAESKADPAVSASGSSRLVATVHILLGLAVLSAFQLVGVGLHELGVPIPGGVLGLLLLYLGLSTGLVKLKWVEDTAAFLLRHMLLLFIPVTLGLMDLVPLLSRQAVAIVSSLLVSLLAVQITTGLLGKVLLGRRDE